MPYWQVYQLDQLMVQQYSLVCSGRGQYAFLHVLPKADQDLLYAAYNFRRIGVAPVLHYGRDSSRSGRRKYELSQPFTVSRETAGIHRKLARSTWRGWPRYPDGAYITGTGSFHCMVGVFVRLSLHLNSEHRAGFLNAVRLWRYGDRLGIHIAFDRRDN